MNLFKHKNKLSSSENLHEAYHQIETLERQEKTRNQERKTRLIQEREETGEKPEGRDRDVEALYRSLPSSS